MSECRAIPHVCGLLREVRDDLSEFGVSFDIWSLSCRRLRQRLLLCLGTPCFAGGGGVQSHDATLHLHSTLRCFIEI